MYNTNKERLHIVGRRGGERQEMLVDHVHTTLMQAVRELMVRSLATGPESPWQILVLRRKRVFV